MDRSSKGFPVRLCIQRNISLSICIYSVGAESYLKLKYQNLFMAQKFEEAENRIFKDVYVCRRCNAKNKTQNPEKTSCRKCGYRHLRKKNDQFAG